MNTPGQRIKIQRTQLGITQKELAEKLNLSLDMVRSLENDRKNPSLETISNLATLFNCSIDYLFGRDIPNGITYDQVIDEIINEYESKEFIDFLEAQKGKRNFIMNRDQANQMKLMITDFIMLKQKDKDS